MSEESEKIDEVNEKIDEENEKKVEDIENKSKYIVKKLTLTNNVEYLKYLLIKENIKREKYKC